MKQNEKEFARREKVAEKLAEIGNVHVEAIHPNGPSGYMYAVDGRLCRDYRDAMQYIKRWPHMDEKIKNAAALLGSISTPKKAASSRENGKRGGRPTEKKTYWILSGEGENGTWKKHTATLMGIKRIATKERCGGDRWAQIWGEIPETETTEAHIYNVDNGDMRDVPDED